MGCRRTFGDKDLRLIDPKIKALALNMYAEAIAATKIERLLHVSHNAVLGWVRKEVVGKALQAPEAKDLSVVEADEMWSYVGSKNSTSGCGRSHQIVGFALGDPGTQTAKVLQPQLPMDNHIHYCTDAHRP